MTSLADPIPAEAEVRAVPLGFDQHNNAVQTGLVGAVPAQARGRPQRPGRSGGES